MSGFAKKPDLGSRPPLPFEDVSVPEWGGLVRVSMMTAVDRDAWEESCVKTERGKDGSEKRSANLSNVRARLVAKCVIDPETGARMFTDAEADALGKQSSKVISILFDVAQRINALTDSDVKELQGKSEAAPEGSSPSSSVAS